MSRRIRKEIELDIGHAIAMIQDHGVCGCSMCALAVRTMDRYQGTQQMEIAIRLVANRAKKIEGPEPL